MKKIIAFLLAFLMIASFAACGDSDTADTVHTENAIADAFAQLIEQISQNGGYISLSTEENLLSYLGIETEGFIISGFDVIIDDNQTQLGILGTYNNKDITDTLYLSDKALVFNTPTLLGGAYGIDFTTISKDWESSYLNPKNGSDNAIPEETLVSLEQLLNMINGKANTDFLGQNAENISKTVTDFINKLVKEIEKVIPVSETTEGNYTTKSIKISLDDISAILNAAADTLQGNAEMKSIINSILDTSADHDTSSVTVDQLITALRSATDYFDMSALEDCELNVILSYKYSKDNMDKTVMFGIEIKQAEESAALAFGIRDQMTNDKTEFTHTISTDVKCTGYFDEILAEDADFAELLTAIKEFKYKTVWNKSSGELQTKIKILDQIVTLNANLKFNVFKNGNLELIFVFEKLVVGNLFDSGDVINAPITLKLSTQKPKSLSIPKYTSVLKDESTIEKIATHMQKEFGAFVNES